MRKVTVFLNTKSKTCFLTCRASYSRRTPAQAVKCAATNEAFKAHSYMQKFLADVLLGKTYAKVEQFEVNSNEYPDCLYIAAAMMRQRNYKVQFVTPKLTKAERDAIKAEQQRLAAIVREENIQRFAKVLAA